MDFFFGGEGGGAWGAHKTPSYDAKMLQVVYDKTAFVNLRLIIIFNKTLMKHIQNYQKSIGRSILANTNGFKRYQTFVISKKKTIP